MPPTTQAGPWWLAVTAWGSNPGNKTQTRIKTVKLRSGEDKETSGWDTPTWGLFMLGSKKDVAKTKQKHIFLHLFCSRKERNPNMLNPACTTFYTDKFSQTSIWQSVHSFSHLCSYWERTVIKLLIAWIFLCIFVKKIKNNNNKTKEVVVGFW